MQMFMEPYDLRSGIILDFFDGSKATIFGRVSILLGDEAALKETLDCKGAAGIFFVLYVRTSVTTSLSFTVMIHVGTSSRARAWTWICSDQTLTKASWKRCAN